MDRFDLYSHSIRAHPWGARIRRVLQAALDAVEPGKAIRHHLHLDGFGTLVASSGKISQSYALNEYEKVFLIGAGKAGLPMVQATANLLGNRISAGAVIVKSGQLKDSKTTIGQHVKLYEAGHPVPDESGVNATKQILDLVHSAGINDLVICLISGGGSALLTQPAEGITLEDLQELTRLLLASGASINEINTLRKHLDLVKGGGLAQETAPAQILTLILSDVIGDPLDMIASGPTVPDSTTYQDAWYVLEKYQLLDKIPNEVLNRISAGLQGKLPETPKPGYPIFNNVTNLIIGSNLLAANAALMQARLEGFNPLLLTTYLQGEARQAGKFFAALAHQIAASDEPVSRPACLIAGGETTVMLRGQGLGGRNQELALGAVQDMAGLEKMLLVTLATDGDDGPTDAAGAVVNGETLVRAEKLGMKPEVYLANNDSYHFFEPLGDLLVPGSTQTNVNDLVFLFAFDESA